MKLLHIDSSILGEASASRELSAAIVQAVNRAMPGAEIIRRDLVADPIPHLDSGLLAATLKGSAVLDEFLGADIVVIGTPMYNFTIPSQLKAWLDRIVIVGKTVRYTEAGAQGLMGDKKVIIASSRGGLYAPGMPQQANDFRRPTCARSSASSASKISTSFAPRASPWGPNSAPRRCAPR